VLAAIFVYTPPFHTLFGTASLTADELLFVLPFPFIVWGADELRRWYVRRRRASVVSHGGSRAVPDGGAAPLA
jgi:hypothetical protein